MAKLPEMRKVTVLVFRRRGPDEILVVRKPSRDGREWAPPSTIAEDAETPETAARRLAGETTHGEPLAVLPLAVTNSYVVKNGPSAGSWTEHFYGIEVAPDARPAQGAAWRVHYEAKAESSAVKVREAITDLRARAKLLP